MRWGAEDFFLLAMGALRYALDPMQKFRPLPLAICLLLCAACPRRDVTAPAAADGGAAADPLQAIAAEQLQAELQLSPTTATWLGDHRYDDRLDELRDVALRAEVARLRAVAERLRRLQEAGTPPVDPVDVQLLLGRVRAQLIELSDLRPGERSPLHYLNVIAFGIDELLGPDFGEARVRPLLRRLKAVPELCREAQRSLKNPSDLSVRRAIELGQASADFLGALLPRLLRGVVTDKLLDESLRASDEARRALEELVAWMGRELLPRARGEWALGREMLVARLSAEELLDVPPERLLPFAERELRETRGRLEEAARQLTGGGRVEAALRLIDEDHPRAEELQRSVEESLSTLYAAASAAQLAPVPARPRLLEMPPYRFGYLLLSAPGPLETRPREALLYVDPVDPAWTDKRRVQEHLKALSRPQQLLWLAHEVLPGRLAQQEALRAAPPPSLVRLRSRSAAFSEGWAHYAEGLVPEALAEGPERDKLRVLVLRAQLWRLGRLVAALRLHLPASGGAAAAARLDDVAGYLSDECYLDDFAARREAERAALDPMVLLPALGRLQIEKLRRDLEEQEGERFSLKAFHAALLRRGELPVVALRQILLKVPGTSLDLP